jgi:hypothetical protein
MILRTLCQLQWLINFDGNESVLILAKKWRLIKSFELEYVKTKIVY